LVSACGKPLDVLGSVLVVCDFGDRNVLVVKFLVLKDLQQGIIIGRDMLRQHGLAVCVQGREGGKNSVCHVCDDVKGVYVMPPSGNGDGDEDGAGRGSMVKTACFLLLVMMTEMCHLFFLIFFLLRRLFMLRHLPLPLPLPLHQCLTM
jgi:hypothetical protein